MLHLWRQDIGLHKCIVKDFRMFVYKTDKYTVPNIFYYIFPTKSMYTMFISTNTKLHIPWSTYTNNKRIYWLQLQSKQNKKTASSLLFPSGHSTQATDQQGKCCLAGQIQPWIASTAKSPHVSSIFWGRGICVCGFWSYTFHLQTKKDSL